MEGYKSLEFYGHDDAGTGWGRYYIGPVQFLVCFGAVVGSTLLAGQTMKVQFHAPQIQPTSILRSAYNSISKSLLAVHVHDIKSRGDDEAVRIRHHLWNLHARARTDTVVPFAEAHQPRLPLPLPRLQRLLHRWCHLRRSVAR